MMDINGTSNADRIEGSWSSDTLNGALGADTLYGGAGDDIYVVDNAGDKVLEGPLFPVYGNTGIGLVSVDADGSQGTYHAQNASVSADGNLVVFDTSDASLYPDLILKNLGTGAATPALMQVLGHTEKPQITPDGHYIAFVSSMDPATGNDNGYRQIFVKDLLTGAVTWESEANVGPDRSHCSAPQISDDGRYLVFSSQHHLLADADSNGYAADVYWRDRVTGETKLVSGLSDGTFQGNGTSQALSVSNDGRYVMFLSYADNFTLANLGHPDSNKERDLFLKDMSTGAITLLIKGFDGVNQANAATYGGQMTPDARYVAFSSYANNLVAVDSNTRADIFRLDRNTGEVIRASIASAGPQANSDSYNPQITPDGRFVVFESYATNLVPMAGDGNTLKKIFVKDLVTGQLELVSRRGDGGLGNTGAEAPGISDDGRFIVFQSRDETLVSGDDGYAQRDIFRVPNPLYGGTDEVRSSVSYTLPAGVENLTLTGSGAISGTGNSLDNSLAGNAGDNVLDGGLGADTLAGGRGNDVYYLDNAGDRVEEAAGEGVDTVCSSLAGYTLGANVEAGRILGTGAANLTGNGRDNVLYAGRGNNVLDGSTGADTVSYLNGVSGSTGVTVSLAGTGAQATGGSGTDTLFGIEHLRGSNYADKLTGDGGANTLTGYKGNDTLDGGAGSDTMIGGAGSDTYHVRESGDVVTEAAGEGSDIVHSYLAAYTLGVNVEHGRILVTAAANLTGNGSDNVLYAGQGSNILDGGTGADTVSYLTGVTGAMGVTVSLENTGAQATGGSGTDTLIAIEHLSGSNYGDKLSGNSGANILKGYDGNDTISGGAGNDSLTGGRGNDVFDFNALAEMGSAGGACDVITDLVRGQDRIDLSTLDANTATTANEAFSGTLISSTASFTAAGQLKLVSGVLYGNTDGDATPEFAIRLTGVTALAAADFVL